MLSVYQTLGFIFFNGSPCPLSISERQSPWAKVTQPETLVSRAMKTCDSWQPLGAVDSGFEGLTLKSCSLESALFLDFADSLILATSHLRSGLGPSVSMPRHNTAVGCTLASACDSRRKQFTPELGAGCSLCILKFSPATNRQKATPS